MYEAVIGLEIHAQIALKSKMFCSCSSDSFDKEPNINTCPVCMGFPGQLPVINEEAVRKGVKASLALHCEVPPFSKFDRKNYFYPDLPKGFQISQYDQPLAVNGWIEVDACGTKKKVGITRLHLEDDAGKLTHIENGTLCDYNRCGIALMEIVSEPDMRSAAEAGAYARAMQTILRYTNSSDADMEKGMMRFDASVSIRPVGDLKLYPRAEIKNLNSFKSLENAIAYEIEKQTEMWEEGKPMNKDITVGWTDINGKTYFLRDKEGADDYRYFPEPDLPPVKITADFIEELRKDIPELPTEKFVRYTEQMEMSEAEATLISGNPDLARYFEEVAAISGDDKRATTFVSTILMAHLKKNVMEIAECKVTAQALADLIKMVNDGKISMNIAKGEVFEEMFEKGSDPAKIVKEKGLGQVSDEGELTKICEEVIAANSGSVADYRGGKAQALGFLVGQVMKETKGQANAQMVNDILKKLIG
ncbi:Asp-tRNA(Asn)/Glu-tRNA(Gln) amidotransferase subunit GatB [Patescibacteria group bacterium]|nr:Asp-tRNA(Asn)/Glu-tRNA(Gln) amidotransferase subunit GatB [Patescibacteria group bacterium]MBU1703381.1 Asp-tRNA(Asn)/Glu-tRNA(Gln) amidotransferase subunit GatB [Patescibacteria group bacterium]MBU1953824.1 Asp-tRNA(Asn)/Glu-tRNA(Gln) amidotransferase subunit GatB [Patescibacteria group bacterium]